jgi:hypothetical protein
MKIIMEVPHSKSLLERTRRRWKDNIIRGLREYVNVLNILNFFRTSSNVGIL